MKHSSLGATRQTQNSWILWTFGFGKMSWFSQALGSSKPGFNP